MIDQERWENVINALELCTSEIETRTQVPCEKCHYHNKEYHGVHGNGCCNMRSLQRDILDLLKAQEPRVMTLEEVCKGLVWLDTYRTSEVEPVYILEMNKRGEIYYLVFGAGARPMLYDEDYNKEYRFWTSRPTDAQREAIPWEG